MRHNIVSMLTGWLLCVALLVTAVSAQPTPNTVTDVDGKLSTVHVYT